MTEAHKAELPPFDKIRCSDVRVGDIIFYSTAHNNILSKIIAQQSQYGFAHVAMCVGQGESLDTIQVVDATSMANIRIRTLKESLENGRNYIVISRHRSLSNQDEGDKQVQLIKKALIEQAKKIVDDNTSYAVSDALFIAQLILMSKLSLREEVQKRLEHAMAVEWRKIQNREGELNFTCIGLVYYLYHVVAAQNQLKLTIKRPERMVVEMMAYIYERYELCIDRTGNNQQTLTLIEHLESVAKNAKDPQNLPEGVSSKHEEAIEQLIQLIEVPDSSQELKEGITSENFIKQLASKDKENSNINRLTFNEYREWLGSGYDNDVLPEMEITYYRVIMPDDLFSSDSIETIGVIKTA